MAESHPNSSTASNPELRERVRALRLPEMEERSSNKGAWLIAGAIVVLTVTGLGFAFKNGAPPDEDAVATAPAGTDEPVAVAQLAQEESSAKPAPSPTPAEKLIAKLNSAGRGGIVLESKGYIIPAHRILVSPKVNGMLLKLDIEEGTRVNKGDVLGVIESIEYEADVDRVKATLQLAEQRALELENGSRKEEIQGAEAELEETKAKLKQLDADHERAERLVKVGGVTQAEYDEIDASRIAQRHRIDRLSYALKLLRDGPRDERKAQAKAEVGQVRAELTKAQWRLDNCIIRAPISGTILKKNAEEGNIVNPIAFNGSYSLCDMADLADLEVDLNIQERDVSRVFQGQKCKVRVEAYPDRIYEGYVSRLMPIADRAKGAIPVRVKVAVPASEEGVYLKPDMGAIVSFYAKDEAPATASSRK